MNSQRCQNWRHVHWRAHERLLHTPQYEMTASLVAQSAKLIQDIHAMRDKQDKQVSLDLERLMKVFEDFAGDDFESN